MNDHSVAAKILRKAGARGGLEADLRAGLLTDPGGELDRADIAALPVMRTSLGDQDEIAVLKRIDLAGALHRFVQKAFVAGHQNGEGGHGNLVRHNLGHFAKNLTVGNDEARFGVSVAVRPGQSVQCFRKSVLLDTDRNRVRVQEPADHHLLGQNEPSLGRRLVDRDHEEHDFRGVHQILDERRMAAVRAAASGNLLLECEDPLPCQRADKQDVMKAIAGKIRGKSVLIRNQVGLVADDQVRNLFLCKELHQLPVGFCGAAYRVDHQNGKVSAVENSLRPLHALFSQRPLVVKSGRIDDHDGPQGQQLHGFGHRIGRGALYIGDHGDLLACDGVDKTRFARISAAKESDMYSLTRRCRVQSHT